MAVAALNRSASSGETSGGLQELFLSSRVSTISTRTTSASYHDVHLTPHDHRMSRAQPQRALFTTLGSRRGRRICWSWHFCHGGRSHVGNCLGRVGVAFVNAWKPSVLRRAVSRLDGSVGRWVRFSSSRICTPSAEPHTTRPHIPVWRWLQPHTAWPWSVHGGSDSRLLAEEGRTPIRTCSWRFVHAIRDPLCELRAAEIPFAGRKRVSLFARHAMAAPKERIYSSKKRSLGSRRCLFRKSTPKHHLDKMDSRRLIGISILRWRVAS